MAYVLSLRPCSPLKRSFSDNPYLASCSPLKESFLGPLGDTTARNVSACSLYTIATNSSRAWNIGVENAPPLASQSLLDLVPGGQEHAPTAQNEHASSLKRFCQVTQAPPLPSRIPNTSNPCSRKLTDIRHEPPIPRNGPAAEKVDVDDTDAEESDLLNLYEAIHIPSSQGHFATNIVCNQQDDQGYMSEALQDRQPFRRWMSTLRRRHLQGRKKQELSFGGGTELLVVRSPMATTRNSDQRTSESITSSVGFITAVKTNSVTIGSTSIVPTSENGLHDRVRNGNRSSNTDVRRSTESYRGALGPIIDESAWLRSFKRRKVVEELIASEESYIADLKVLINDYFMILTALPALPEQTKSSIQQNIAQILHLHEDLFAELQRAIPQADFTRTAQQETYPITKAKHIRFHSADIVPGRLGEHRATHRLRHSLELGRSPDRRPRGLVTDTKTVGNIAKIFNRHMKRFFTYEEYGAHWTTMSSDLTTMCRGLHGWPEYERGVEALQKVVASENSRESGSRKALSFPDLLIKPIQRVFCDDPEAHAELVKALFRLQETIREVNKAKDDPRTRRLIEITWQLQDRLIFDEQAISRALIFRLLGHVLLCGVLHVAYQTPERLRGQYMICILYKTCLVLATTNRLHTFYNVVACIGLANGSIEEADNGRGIQCHTAAHTWKVIFEYNHRLHEIILSACSSEEERVWKTQLRGRIICETHDFVEGQSTTQELVSSLTLDIKSLGPVFGHADNVVRRMSVHRAATLGAKTNLAQVIIKNTQARKSPGTPPAAFSSGVVTRSQSLLSTNLVPTLAPRRTERLRLEAALEEVWTKDVLPFPGMSNRKVENQIRASANSVMRKLSMASIASNFSRRSPSFSSTSNTRSEDSQGSRAHITSRGSSLVGPVSDRRPAPTVVDFHSAPAAFLPTDFELRDTRPTNRRRRLANRAGGVERSTERPTPVRPKRTRRLSSHIISLPRSESSTHITALSNSLGSTDTIVREPEPTPNSAYNRENLPLKLNGARESSASGDPSPPPQKKSLRSKSRIFKFWL